MKRAGHKSTGKNEKGGKTRGKGKETSVAGRIVVRPAKLTITARVLTERYKNNWAASCEKGPDDMTRDFE